MNLHKQISDVFRSVDSDGLELTWLHAIKSCWTAGSLVGLYYRYYELLKIYGVLFGALFS